MQWDSFDWQASDMERLWRYNLHYFDYLRDPSLGEGDKIQLIDSWIACNPQGSEPGWEPFTVSLRVVNWIFFLSSRPGPIEGGILRSLYAQVLWLEKNDERHILANHYFENLKALAFAGAFFSGKDADRWRHRAEAELQEQIHEQTLGDGGHFERSPQYHGLMLENYLDLYNLAIENAELLSPEFSSCCALVAGRGLLFLQQICFPDKCIPLFNDSAFGVSPSIDQFQEYQERLGFDTPGSQVLSLIDFPESGFFGFRHDNSMVIFDAGDVGPAYQPGHTHCDMLSYELMWEGERIIVDTGVCEYEPGQTRQYVRSTRAHNTVSVDLAEQSEIWGEFRVARRAQVLRAEVVSNSEGFRFLGEYKGFPSLRGKYIHRRIANLTFTSDGAFEALDIQDLVIGKGVHQVETFVHLHPDIVVEEESRAGLSIATPQKQRFKIAFPDSIEFFVDKGIYCPEFGLKVTSTYVVLKIAQKLPAQLSYSITKIS